MKMHPMPLTEQYCRELRDKVMAQIVHMEKVVGKVEQIERIKSHLQDAYTSLAAATLLAQGVEHTEDDHNYERNI